MVGLKPPEVPPTAAMKFVSAGTAACIADLCTFPLDTAKVRLQVRATAPPSAPPQKIPWAEGAPRNSGTPPEQAAVFGEVEGVDGGQGDAASIPQIQGEVRIPRSTGTVEYRGVLGTLSTMVRTEGPRSLYSGLAAGLQRQMSFASIRIGLYDSVKQLYTPKGAESECPGTPRPLCTPGNPLPEGHSPPRGEQPRAEKPPGLKTPP